VIVLRGLALGLMIIVVRHGFSLSSERAIVPAHDGKSNAVLPMA
jgi:hypothetical protein